MNPKSGPGQNLPRYDIVARAFEEMVEAGFTPTFEQAVQEQIAQLDQVKVSSPKDLRNYLWSSIDNKESRDLDQIEYAEQLPDGTIRLTIGIADVATFVPKASAIDVHAGNNSTSVYTGVATFPMLPEALSYHLTSLLPGQDRLAMCIELTVDNEGQVIGSKAYQALVRNHAKLDYRSVGKWLDAGVEPPEKIAAVKDLTAQILLQDQARQRIQALREKMGSLSLHTQEATTVAKNGEVLDLELVETNPARDLIENCMIAANIATSKFLQSKGVPSLRRMVKTPERWSKIVDVAATYGYSLPVEPDAPALSKFLIQQRASDAANFAELSLTIVKLLGRGQYAVKIPGVVESGHFALAINDYTHSTAPNRRYPDLVTQRLLQAVLNGAPAPYTVEELNAIAEKCNRIESQAKKVERKMRKIAAAVLMANRLGDIFNGIVTGVKAGSVYVRTFRPPVEGRVVAGHNLKDLDVGDKIKVRLQSTDPESAHIDFILAN